MQRTNLTSILEVCTKEGDHGAALRWAHGPLHGCDHSRVVVGELLCVYMRGSEREPAQRDRDRERKRWEERGGREGGEGERENDGGRGREEGRGQMKRGKEYEEHGRAHTCVRAVDL